MFSRVLVANRGEIAVRVIRALHELEIEAVAIYSTADKDSMHVRLADRAVAVGPPPASQSYLNIPSVIAAATTTGCEAIRSCSRTTSMPVTSSLTGCSTWRRAFSSMK